MKKILCTALSAVFITGSFASCSAPAKNYSPKITVSSSDAVSDAEWLTNRLDNLTDNVHLGIGSDEFDMTGFEDDGYIIRSSGGEAVIVGKTAEGLTNGVRKYANHAESGTSGELDISYHEGYRVDKFTLAGVDISEYAIEYPESYNENMKFAVSEFIQLTEKACGVKLSSSVGITDRKYAIEFRHSTDAELKSTGYRYFFENSRFIIEGAVERGCMYGVYRFFKNEFNWMGLTKWKFFNVKHISCLDSVLTESEQIDIPSDIHKTETSAFYSFITHLTEDPSRVSDSTFAIYETNYIACHGMQNRKWGWGNYDFATKQPCYSDGDMYTDILDSIVYYLQEKADEGYIIGETFKTLDISQGDNAAHCRCNDCMNVFKEEGNAHSGSVVRFANRISDDLEGDFPGLTYLIFAYAGTQKPPKTAARPNVSVTMCFDGSCSAHPIATGECPFNFKKDGMAVQNNSDLAQWLRGWSEISQLVNVWYYMMDHNVDSYTALKVMYDDMTFFKECRVNQVFMESETADLGVIRPAAELADEMNWDRDMTREEYEQYLCKILKKEYGDGWDDIREYIDIWQESQDRSSFCFHCWGYPYTYHLGQYSYDYVAEKFDYCVELIDSAIDRACDEREVRNCEKLAIHILYQGCLSSYFREYDEGDTERLEVLGERYDRMISIVNKYNIKVNKINPNAKIKDTLEAQAWSDWVKIRESLPCGETVRSAPVE